MTIGIGGVVVPRHGGAGLGVFMLMGRAGWLVFLLSFGLFSNKKGYLCEIIHDDGSYKLSIILIVKPNYLIFNQLWLIADH